MDTVRISSQCNQVESGCQESSMNPTIPKRENQTNLTHLVKTCLKGTWRGDEVEEKTKYSEVNITPMDHSSILVILSPYLLDYTA